MTASLPWTSRRTPRCARRWQKETKDAAVLIVAQRVSTIRHADQIIVLHEGQMAGIGTHDELLQDMPRSIGRSMNLTDKGGKRSMSTKQLNNKRMQNGEQPSRAWDTAKRLPAERASACGSASSALSILIYIGAEHLEPHVQQPS